jgi:hypothetical protein
LWLQRAVAGAIVAEMAADGWFERVRQSDVDYLAELGALAYRRPMW